VQSFGGGVCIDFLEILRRATGFVASNADADYVA
jgi:hypothetical protein